LIGARVADHGHQPDEIARVLHRRYALEMGLPGAMPFFPIAASSIIAA
jgi:hypothetical protein